MKNLIVEPRSKKKKDTLMMLMADMVVKKKKKKGSPYSIPSTNPLRPSLSHLPCGPHSSPLHRLRSTSRLTA